MCTINSKGIDSHHQGNRMLASIASVKADMGEWAVLFPLSKRSGEGRPPDSSNTSHVRFFSSSDEETGAFANELEMTLFFRVNLLIPFYFVQGRQVKSFAFLWLFFVLPEELFFSSQNFNLCPFLIRLTAFLFCMFCPSCEKLRGGQNFYSTYIIPDIHMTY